MEENKVDGDKDCSESQPRSCQGNASWDLANYPFAERAYDLAKEALANGEVPIGCVFAYFPEVDIDEEKTVQPIIIGEGYNTTNETRNPTSHAEMNAIDEAIIWAKKNEVPLPSLWPRTSAIVTVEPCVMCAAAMLSLGVRFVRYGCANKRFGGCGSILDVVTVFGPKAEAGSKTPECTQFVGGWRSDEAVVLLKEFYKGENPNAPRDKVKRKNGKQTSDSMAK